MAAAHCTYHAPIAFEAYIHCILCASRSTSRPLSPAPAAWSTPLSTLGETSAVTLEVSALSHASTTANVPNVWSCASRACPSRTTRPPRDARSTREAPRSKSRMAARIPSPPRPPVIAYGPRASAVFGVEEVMHARNRATTCMSLIHAASVSIVGVGNVTAAATHETSILCVHSAGSSRRITRAKPHAPPFASLDGALPKASTPLVNRSTRDTR